MTTELVIHDDRHYLEVCSEIRSLVTAIETVGEAKGLADRAAAAQTWARRARLGAEQANLATIAKLWAERRAGELLAQMRTSGERDPGGRGGVGSRPAIQLKDLDISPDESSRWQRLAAIEPAAFSDAIESAAEEGRVTNASVLRAANGKYSYVSSPPEDLHDTRREIRTLWDRATIFNQYDVRTNLRKMSAPDREELIERLTEAKEALDRVVFEATSIRNERPRLALADAKGAQQR